MQRVQDPGGHAPAYCEAVQAEDAELRTRHHTVLPASQVRDRLSARRWQRIVADSATYLCHLARVALRVLREGDSCNGCVTTGARGP
jgi:hypothetical protein